MSGVSVWIPGGEVSTVNPNTTLKQQTFTATQGQTDFNLTNFSYLVGAGALLVFYNSGQQALTTNYLELSSTSIRFNFECNLNDQITVYGFVGITATITDVVFWNNYYLASGAETLIPVGASYQIGTGTTAIYRDGLRLIPNIDYTELADSHYVLLTTPATLNQEYFTIVGKMVNDGSTIDGLETTYQAPIPGSKLTNLSEKVSRTPDLLDLIEGSGYEAAAELQAVIDWADPYAIFSIPAGITAYFGSQIHFNKPCVFVNNATIKAFGAGSLGTELFKIGSSDVQFINQGLMDGQGSAWSGISAQGVTGNLENITIIPGRANNWNPNEVSVAQYFISIASVIAPYVGKGYLTNMGGWGVYSQFCEDLVAENIRVDRVNYSGINSSANLNAIFRNCQVHRCGYFNFKSGFGICGSITNNVTPTLNTFSVAGTSANRLCWKAGVRFQVVETTYYIIRGTALSVTDNGTHLTIVTATNMLATPSVGKDLEITDYSTFEHCKATWSGDNAWDINIGELLLVHPVVRHAGQYLGYGAGRLSLGSGIWGGADPQGANTGFVLDRMRVINPDIQFCHGSGIQMFGSGEDCVVEGGVIKDVCQGSTRQDGSYVANDIAPQRGCIEYNLLTFGPGSNFNIKNVTMDTKNGFAAAMSYCSDSKMSGINAKAAKGLMIIDSQGGNRIDSCTAVTTIAGSQACDIAYGGQTTNGVSISGNTSLRAYGAGSTALMISTTNASDIFISDDVELICEAAGNKIVNNSPSAVFNSEYDNAVSESMIVVPANGTIRRSWDGLIAAGATKDIALVYGDNGTNGSLEFNGVAWDSVSAKETFKVFTQGDSGTIVTNSPVFTSLGSSNGTQFMNLAVPHDFTAVSSAGGWKVSYTNHTANTVRIEMVVEGISRY